MIHQSADVYIRAQFLLLINVFILSVTTLILTSHTPSVFAERNLYTCYGITDNASAVQNDLCDLEADDVLPGVCTLEGQQFTLTNYLGLRKGSFGYHTLRPNSTTYEQVVPAGGSVVLPSDTQNYTSPISHSAGAASLGTLTVDPSGFYSYVHTGAEGNETFTYTVSDADGNSVSADVHFKISSATAPNIEYYAGPQVMNLLVDTTQDFETAFGVEVGVYAIEIMSQPSFGSLSTTAPFTYTPNTGYVGEDSFTYRLTDGAGTDSSVQTVYIKVHDPLAPLHAMTRLFKFNGSDATALAPTTTHVSQLRLGSEALNVLSSGGEFGYFYDGSGGQDLEKTETHTYTATAPLVDPSLDFEEYTFRISAFIGGDVADIRGTAIDQPQRLQTLRVEGQNDEPVISQTDAIEEIGGYTVSAQVDDINGDEFDVVFETSTDSFNTLADTFTVSNQTNGSFSHTFQGINENIQFRIRANEVDSNQEYCAGFSNSLPRTSLAVETQSFGVTNLNTGGPAVLVRTGAIEW